MSQAKTPATPGSSPGRSSPGIPPTGDPPGGGRGFLPADWRNQTTLWMPGLIVLGLLFLALALFVPFSVRQRGYRTINTPMRSVLTSNYDMDPFSFRVPQVGLRLIENLIGDLLTPRDTQKRLETLEVNLKTPVPTVTPSVPGVVSTPTPFVVNTATPTNQPPTLTGTALTGTPTLTITPSPSPSRPGQATATRTVTPTRTTAPIFSRTPTPFISLTPTFTRRVVTGSPVVPSSTTTRTPIPPIATTPAYPPPSTPPGPTAYP